MSISIAGAGSYLPRRVLTNADLEKTVETSDEWIVTRTGIRRRHIAGGDETVSMMGAEAARRAVEDAGVSPGDVDLIVVASATPEAAFPNIASLVQRIIGAKNAFCFDLSAACSGFLYALETARGIVDGGTARNALVIGTEKFSGIVDWKDRDTCVLFGDGAGAVFVKRTTSGRGLMSVVAGSDGELADILKVAARDGGPADAGRPSRYIMMNGREVFKQAVRCMIESSRLAMEKCGVSVAEIDWMVPHQANLRIVQAIAERIGIPMEKIYLNLERVGNISAASVPVAIDEAARKGLFKRGQILLITVAGAGFTWGSGLLEW